MVRCTGSVSDDTRLNTKVEGCPEHDTTRLVSHTDRQGLSFALEAPVQRDSAQSAQGLSAGSQDALKLLPLIIFDVGLAVAGV